ncbi:MAG: hypothetical protein M0C28_15595 [Candidatus Moduliflexus flocculans]|nr:hypothetical protein [Candidatus Moduliflexus flocculans]
MDRTERRMIEIVDPGRLAAGLAREPPRPRRGEPSSAASGSGTRTVWKPDGREISEPPRLAGRPRRGRGRTSRTWRPSRPPSAAKGSSGPSSWAWAARAWPRRSSPARSPRRPAASSSRSSTRPNPAPWPMRRPGWTFGRTLFLVSSKSGSTAELVALLSFFYERTVRALGESRRREPVRRHHRSGQPSRGAGRVAPVPPDLPRPARHRRTLLRPFGLRTPARRPSRASTSDACSRPRARRPPPAGSRPPQRIPAPFSARSWARRRSGALDKLTFLVPPRLCPFAGLARAARRRKHGQGRPGHRPGHRARARKTCRLPGEDRLFVDLPDSPAADARTPGSGRSSTGANPSSASPLGEPYALGGHFFLWEFATAVAGHLLGINPFDQPDVESTKKKTRQILAAAGGGPDAEAPRVSRIRRPRIRRPRRWPRFLAGRRDGDYLAILAFLPRRPGIETALSGLAGRLAPQHPAPGHGRIRAAVPPLDRPAAQGRREPGALSHAPRGRPAGSRHPRGPGDRPARSRLRRAVQGPGPGDGLAPGGEREAGPDGRARRTARSGDRRARAVPGIKKGRPRSRP